MKNANSDYQVQSVILSENDVNEAIFLIDSILANQDSNDAMIDVLVIDEITDYFETLDFN